MKSILVALDGSERSTLVLEKARALSAKLGNKLILYRAIGLPPEVPVDYWKTTTSDLGTVLVADAKQALDALKRTLPADMVEQCVVELAIGWDGICQAAKRHDVELIVMGSHGYGGLDRLLGTTAARVVNHADRSVLVVR